MKPTVHHNTPEKVTCGLGWWGVKWAARARRSAGSSRGRRFRSSTTHCPGRRNNISLNVILNIHRVFYKYENKTMRMIEFDKMKVSCILYPYLSMIQLMQYSKHLQGSVQSLSADEELKNKVELLSLEQTVHFGNRSEIKNNLINKFNRVNKEKKPA